VKFNNAEEINNAEEVKNVEEAEKPWTIKEELSKYLGNVKSSQPVFGYPSNSIFYIFLVIDYSECEADSNSSESNWSSKSVY